MNTHREQCCFSTHVIPGRGAGRGGAAPRQLCNTRLLQLRNKHGEKGNPGRALAALRFRQRRGDWGWRAGHCRWLKRCVSHATCWPSGNLRAIVLLVALARIL